MGVLPVEVHGSFHTEQFRLFLHNRSSSWVLILRLLTVLNFGNAEGLELLTFNDIYCYLCHHEIDALTFLVKL